VPRASPPPYRAQLAQLAKVAPSGPAWVHEIKYDGYRIGCAVEGGRATLLSRRGNDWTAHFPEVAAAARGLPVREALLDGEVAIVLPDGKTSFQALQNALSERPPRRALAYFVFDLLHLDGEDLSALPLLERKARLEALLGRGPGVLRYAEHFEGDGAVVLREACRLGLEGIVSKRRDEPYRPGRGGGWVKTKCVLRQELVIGGFTEPEGSRAGIGALLVGFHQAGALRYAGKVGTGFTNASAIALRRRLGVIETDACPFSPRPAGWIGRHARWVTPALVAEVAFTEWTGDGKVRHPSFQGLREDKRPEEVVREEPRSVAAAGAARRSTGSAATEVSRVRVSSPARVMFPDLGATKLDVVRYYDAVAEAMVPHLRGRPLTLYHCPEGLAGACRFMKHSKVWAPAAVRRVRIREKTKVGEYLVADTREALLSIAQMDVLELHTWNSTTDALEEPDRIVIDLDPGPEVRWPEVVRVALFVKGALDALGLASFAKTTGGAGLHVVVPLRPERDWTECLGFARALAGALAAHDPRRLTTSFARAGRERKILLDYLRNNRTNTSVAAFSLRARPDATVSVPIAWDELSARARPDRFTLRTVPRRLARLRSDPWRGYDLARRPLTSALVRSVETGASP
jgi:bifunctional non-homologous end joining protein LigD